MAPLRLVLPLCFAVAALAQHPILIDTDAGSDDLMAIAFLASQPSVRIEAITVVNGLAHPDAKREEHPPFTRNGLAAKMFRSSPGEAPRSRERPSFPPNGARPLMTFPASRFRYHRDHRNQSQPPII